MVETLGALEETLRDLTDQPDPKVIAEAYSAVLVPKDKRLIYMIYDFAKAKFGHSKLIN